MIYNRLGNSGIHISKLCLGTMNFGEHCNERESHRLIETAFDAGINFFDTANVYGSPKGSCERILGNWIKASPHKRSQIVLASKVCGKMGSTINEQGLSAYHLIKACDDSLRRMKTDHIDLYQLHKVDATTQFEETIDCLNRLIQQGKILYWGTSNFASWQIANAFHLARHRSFQPLISEQGKYSLMNRSAELDILPACKCLGVGFLAWGPLEGGALAEPNIRGVKRNRGFVQEKIDRFKVRMKAWSKLCERVGVSQSEVALSWLLSNKDVTSLIIGPRIPTQIGSAIKALSHLLSETELREIEEIWPGPKALLLGNGS